VVLQLRNLQMCEQSSQKLTCHKFPVLTLPISSLTKLQVYNTEAQKQSCQAESKIELTSAVKVTLLAFAAAAPCCGAAAAGRQAVDALDNISYPHGAQQQTRRTLWSNDVTDRQTD